MQNFSVTEVSVIHGSPEVNDEEVTQELGRKAKRKNLPKNLVTSLFPGLRSYFLTTRTKANQIPLANELTVYS